MPVGRGVLSGKPALAAGRRDRYVTILTKTEDNSAGYPVEDFVAISPSPREWMSRRDLRADERFSTAQDSAYAETQWVSGYRPDMDPEIVDVPSTKKLRFQNRDYDIIACSLMEGKRGIEYLTLGGSKVDE